MAADPEGQFVGKLPVANLTAALLDAEGKPAPAHQALAPGTIDLSNLPQAATSKS